jgi:hypothetical protein
VSAPCKYHSVRARLTRRCRARLGIKGEAGFTFVSVLVSMLLLAIAMAMIVPLMSVLVTTYHRDTRTLSADSSQARLSLIFDRIIQDAYPPRSRKKPKPAVSLDCPNAMELYSLAPLPEAPNGGGWVYIYLSKNLSKSPSKSPTLSRSSKYSVYTLHVEELSPSSLNPFKPSFKPTTCSSSSKPLTPPSSDVEAVILTLHDVVARSGQPFFFNYYSLFEWGSSTIAIRVSSFGQVSSSGQPIDEIAYKITVRHLSCTVCSKAAITSGPVQSPKVTMQGTLLLPNVLINEGQGAGLF